MSSYKDDLEIDKNNLDEAWQYQALKFAEWAEKEVEAMFQRDKLKDQLELQRAGLDSLIRKNPSNYFLDKVTESAIQNIILQNENYQKSNTAYLDAVKQAKIFGVAREAFDHRKKALEKLTDLFLSQYWAEPREGRITKKVMEEKDKDVHLKSLEGRIPITKRRPI